MVRIERDTEFWKSIVTHPSVSDQLPMGIDGFMNCIAHPGVKPFASENGGYLVIDTGSGLVAEFHTVFTEAGRGKEALFTGCEVAQKMFETHSLLTTYETSTNKNSRPPLSCGFQVEDNWGDTPYGKSRLWFLTKSRWQASPAYRRIVKCL